MSRVMITGARAPVALHLARLFHQAGHEVILADSQRFPLGRATRLKLAYVRLPSPRGNMRAYAQAVEAAVARHGCDLVVPTCEEVFFLAAARDLHGKAIPLLAPPFAVLARAHNKGHFAGDAMGLGADPPESRVLTSRQDLLVAGDLGGSILKPVWSRFASRVLVRPTREQAAAIVPTEADSWLLQDYLPGEDICCYGVAFGGALQAFAAYRPLYRVGLGAGIAFEPVSDAAAWDFAAGYVAATGWTGQLSFDFRRDVEGRLRVIECNPRATSGLHFFGPGDGLVQTILEGSSAMPTDRRAMTLKLAMLAYGLPSAIRAKAVGRWWRDINSMGDITAFPGDRSLFPAQFLALAEIAVIALRSGKSLQQAATDDIEWNGESLG